MLRVLSVASEMYPAIKTGGLADVTGALPLALRALDVATRTLLPGYPAVVAQLADVETVWEDDNYFGGKARLLSGRIAELDLLVLDAPHLYARPGYPYTMPDGQDWADNPRRFAALAFAASMIGHGVLPDYVPDVVHSHDWQTGLAPAYLALSGGPRPATIFTLHNLAFQGQVPASLLAELRLPQSAYTPDGLEYYGAIGMLKAGLHYADRLTTVSPSYAEEICTPGGGMGMDGVLRGRAGDLVGILNGIDTQVWDPANDAVIPSPFSLPTRARRGGNKVALQRQFGLEPGRATLLFGMVSRLTHQKGLDLVLACLPDLLSCGAQLVVLGSGDADISRALAQAAADNPGRIGVIFGYDEQVAHLIQAGSDAILVPSRFEPCGLTQLCAMRYGAVPVVSRVGGLADSIVDANFAALAAGVATGVQFWPVTQAGLQSAIQRTHRLWGQRDVWSRLQMRGLRTDVGWNVAARAYSDVYARAVAGKAAGR